MVTTRSGKILQLKKRLKHKTRSKQKQKKKFLTCDMIRDRGDRQHHQCKVCLARMQIHQFSDFLQCPACKDVFHSSCILKHIRLSLHPTCPSCRNEIDCANGNISDIEETWAFTVECDEDKDYNSDYDSDSNSYASDDSQ